MVPHKTTHEEQLVLLRRIEGQVRGIQKMIGEKRYCVDILTQLTSIRGAIAKVEENIFHKHLEGCVCPAMESTSEKEKQEKIQEVLDLVSRFRK